MKKDADLTRRILLELASEENTDGLKGLEGVDQAVFAYHAQLLNDDHYVIAHIHTYLDDADDAHIQRLTNKGHELAAQMEDDTVWAEVKEKVVKPGRNWSLGVLAEVLKATLIKHMLGG